MIRLAQLKDIPKILDLLRQVDLIHHNGRPDIFKVGAKYNANEIESLIRNATEPILVAVDEKDEVLGYCFGNALDLADAEQKSLAASDYLKKDSTYYKDIIKRLWTTYNRNSVLKESIDRICGKL